MRSKFKWSLLGAGLIFVSAFVYLMMAAKAKWDLGWALIPWILAMACVHGYAYLHDQDAMRARIEKEDNKKDNKEVSDV